MSIALVKIIDDWISAVEWNCWHLISWLIQGL